MAGVGLIVAILAVFMGQPMCQALAAVVGIPGLAGISGV